MQQWDTLLVTVVTLLFMLSHVQCRHMRRTTCEGGRAEGDKWFDGCQWCVCEPGGPVCSPRECSEHVAHVPPCDNLGSKWRDGCYHCTCGISGIDCQADRACVSTMRSGSGGQNGFLSGGRCLPPMDFRCICGVDGVPSCSAEVIDRSDYTSTLIALQVSNRFSHSIHPKRHGSKHIIIHEEDLIRPRTKRNTDSTYEFNSLQRQERSSRRRNFNSRRYDNWDNTAEYEYRRGSYDELDAFPSRAYNRRASTKSTNYPKHTRILSDYQRDEEDRSINSLSDTSFTVHKSHSDTALPSLLVATDNRCRFGPRWYGGSLRCYCDVSGSVTCGDPSFVASRIDGFLVESRMCEPGHVWEEEESCLSCECQFSNLVVCKRSNMCPLPLLIAEQKKDGRRTEFRDGEEDRWLPKGGRKSDDDDEDEELVIEIGDDDDIRGVDQDGSSGHYKDDDDERPRKDEDVVLVTETDVVDIELNPESEIVLQIDDDDVEVDIDDDSRDRSPADKRKDHRRKPSYGGRDRGLYTTMVTVRECKPGSRWREGCTTCQCSMKGRKRCDDSRCPKFFTSPVQAITIAKPGDKDESKTDSSVYRRPMQRPPPMIGGIRTKPISTQAESLKMPCGKFRVNERYWKQCNLCVCTRKGPRCTAKSCG